MMLFLDPHSRVHSPARVGTYALGELMLEGFPTVRDVYGEQSRSHDRERRRKPLPTRRRAQNGIEV
jgi:hypothetical protein